MGDFGGAITIRNQSTKKRTVNDTNLHVYHICFVFIPEINGFIIVFSATARPRISNSSSSFAGPAW